MLEPRFFFRDSGTKSQRYCTTIETADGCTAEYKNIDELLRDIGANGRFQWLLFATLLLFHAPGDITYFGN